MQSEIEEFLKNKIKNCPLCNNNGFGLQKKLYGLSAGHFDTNRTMWWKEDSFFVSFVLTCNNCGYIMLFSEDAINCIMKKEKENETT